jgi:hypothetical protein
MALMSKKTLRNWFLTYNRRYFNGRLPEDTVLEWSSKMVSGTIERAHIHGATQCTVKGCDRSFIRMHPKIRNMECVVLLTLLHAMVHLDGHISHGPKFQRGMKRLADRGAFRDLW